ncbi:hypothetical protein [Shimia sp.]|uniref:hypothetical protein n=1 Tax=Shimia sp. TaxID=1954381 RepID=UPI003567BDF7
MSKAILGSACIAIAGLSLSGCAKSPDSIQATYVSPSTYASYSCRSLAEERNNIVNQVNDLSGKQKKEATEDAVATGVGLLLFWPALFFLADNGDLEPQIASLKGHYDAVSKAWHEKGCK